MSQLFVDDVVNKEGTGSVGFSKGISVSVASTFSGAVTIGGTLTYEDVTNVEATGIITAKGGIKIGAAGIGGTIAANGDTTLAGVVTATTFVGNLTGNPTGSAAGLTNVPGGQITGALAAVDGSALTGMASTDNVSTSTLHVVGISTLLGNVGIGTTFAQLQLHIQDGKLASAPTPNSNCDVVIEGASNTGIQFLSATQTQLRFGDAAENAAGALIYQHTDDNFKLNYKTGTGKVSLNDGGGEKASFGTGGLNVSGMASVGAAITMYGATGIVSATAYYGDGSNLSGAGGMWTKMVSVDVASGTAGNDYEIFTDFASHTDKKWWKLVFRIESSANDFSGSGLQVKSGGAWKTSDYKWQQFYVEGTSEVANNYSSQSYYALATNDEKWRRGEVTFFNPHLTSLYKCFEYTGICLDHDWASPTATDMPKVERSAGGWVGGTGALQGIRWYQQTGSAWGAMNFALFAGNGW
tara:strand:+ start:168 stop:1571 length:1404 start_codon:yes stop_codon:yes gene_type:complete